VRFADTAYFLALLNPQDGWHQPALLLSRRREGPLLTTVWILLEVGDALATGPNRQLFPRWLDSLLASAHLEIVPATNDWFFRGLALYRARPDKEWSLTDCISFVVMGERSLTEALTSDHHFEQAGFTALLKAP
jgi:predicted nucleic acid-binding protein